MHMITIQEVGSQILNQKPMNFYIFCGNEYGIKMKYISFLTKYYDGRVNENNKVMDVITYMRTNHFIPPEPSLYIIRYDDDFISGLSEAVAKVIFDTKIIGTIVCIYENEKHTQKLDKFFPDHTVSIGSVNHQFIEKYLLDDFKTIPENCVKNVAGLFDDYRSAFNVCNSLKLIDTLTLQSLSKDDIRSSVYVKPDDEFTSNIKKVIASRNYDLILKAIEAYPTSLDNFLYDLLSTMLELEKLTCLKSDSDLTQYLKRWNINDIYNLFQCAYVILNEIRTDSTATQDRILFLVSLIPFNPIPGVGEFHEL